MPNKECWLIKSHLLNRFKFPFKLLHVDGTAGITANDALSIQKYTLRLIDELPE